MPSVKGTVSSCWRRRSLTNKIITGVIQGLVAISAWEVFTSVLSSKNESTDDSGNKNVRSVGQPSSPGIDTSRAITLNLLDLSSIIYTAEQPSHDRSLTYHLKTNVYIRDEKFSFYNMYPVGALVNFGELKARLISDSPNCAQENTASDKTSSGNSLRVNIDPYDSRDDRSLNSASTVKVTSTSSNERNMDGVAYDFAHGNSANQGGSRAGSHSLAVQGAGINYPQYQHDSLNLKIPPSNEQPNAVRIHPVGKPQSDPLYYMKMINQNIAKRLEATVAPQDVVPDYKQFGYKGQVSMDSLFNDPVSDNILASRGLLVDESGEKLYADGFLDRVTKLTSELYGAGVNKSANADTSIKLVLNCPNVCRDLKKVDVLFLINSLPQNAEQRQKIRDTFVNSAHFPDYNIVHVFLIGKKVAPSYDQRLNQEQTVHQDIVEGDFLDEPDNATIKGIMGMRWVTQFCFTAKYIMKINEDVFVDTDKLMHGLIPAIQKVNNKRMMICYFSPESALIRTGPDAIRDYLFPGRTRLRPYCKGFAILLTRGAVFSLVAASDYMKPIYLDDLYLYGILPFVAGSVEVYDVGFKRAFHNFGLETVNCYKTLGDKCPLVASVAFLERFTNLWSFVEMRFGQPHRAWENEQSLWNIIEYKRRI